MMQYSPLTIAIPTDLIRDHFTGFRGGINSILIDSNNHGNLRRNPNTLGCRRILKRDIVGAHALFSGADFFFWCLA